MSLLSVSAPELALVWISDAIVRNSPELNRQGVMPGVYLGSREVPGGFDLNKMPGDVHSLVGKIDNVDEASGALVFDAYVWNADRNNLGNILLAPSEGEKYRFYLIDHGHCFSGQEWRDESLPARASAEYDRATHPLLANCAAVGKGGEQYLEQVENIAEEWISDLVNQPPAEWNFAESSRRAMKEYLVERRRYTRRDCKKRGVRCQ